MNAYVEAPQPSRGLQRIVDALKQYAPPSVTFVEDERDADFVFLHAIGRYHAMMRRAWQIRSHGHRYAVGQWCLRSTKEKRSGAWWDLWKDAATVWSYYDLSALLAEDGYARKAEAFEYYHAPLGVDANVFKPLSDAGYPNQDYLITVTGESWLTESVREVVTASAFSGQTSVCVGRARGMPRHYTQQGGPLCYRMKDISDVALRDMYARSRFVSGLRRIEGFELPAAEGVLCGARPILFDRPHYRQWHDEWGIFVSEEPRAAVVESLKTIFRNADSYPPVSASQRAAAANRFDWSTIIAEFWNRII